MVPDAVRHVARDVGVERGVLHVVAHVVGEPTAAVVLHAAEPLVGALGVGEASAHVEGHRGLDQVPRVGVTARHPRDVAVGLLHRGDRVDGPRHIVGGDDPGNLG